MNAAKIGGHKARPISGFSLRHTAAQVRRAFPPGHQAGIRRARRSVQTVARSPERREQGPILPNEPGRVLQHPQALPRPIEVRVQNAKNLFVANSRGKTPDRPGRTPLPISVRWFWPHGKWIPIVLTTTFAPSPSCQRPRRRRKLCEARRPLAGSQRAPHHPPGVRVRAGNYDDGQSHWLTPITNILRKKDIRHRS